MECMEGLNHPGQRVRQAEAFFRRPLIAFEGARALYLGPALGLKPHRNAAFTLAVGLDAPIRLTLLADRSGSSTTTEGSIVSVPAGHLHRLEAQGLMAFLYLDALGDDATRIGPSDMLAAHRILTAEKRDALRLWGIKRWRMVLGVSPPVMVDPRAAAVAQAIVRDPDTYATLSEAARAAALSPTRFHAVFRQHLGAPFRRYRLWRRMGHALVRLGSGANLTEAAHTAGFASSAHFSYQFSRMFGLSPSALMALRPEIRDEEHRFD
jgi:AraC-like DNA-binding protein